MSSSKQLDSQAMVDAATQADRTPATTEQVMPIFNAAYSDVAALKEMLQSLHARLKDNIQDEAVVLKCLSLFHACLYAGKVNKTEVMQLATSLPFELQKTVVQSTEAAKTLRLYSIYLEMRMTIYSSGTKADVVAAKWVAAEEKANAKTKAEQKAFALSSTSLKSRRMSCISIKQGLVEEGRMLVDLLRSLTTTISRFGQDDPDGEDQLNQHAVNILEQDLFHLSSAICEAVISVLAVFTKLKLEDARAGLALYASSIEAINGAKSCCRACHLSPATRESMAALKLPNSDLFLALADHVGKLSEAAEKGNTSTSSSHNKSGSLSSGKGTSLSRKQSSTSARLGDKASVSTPPISPKKPKGHKRIASLPESLAGAAAKTGLFKSVGRALRHT